MLICLYGHLLSESTLRIYLPVKSEETFLQINSTTSEASTRLSASISARFGSTSDGEPRYRFIGRCGFNRQVSLSQNGHIMIMDNEVRCLRIMTTVLCKLRSRFFIPDPPNPSLNRKPVAGCWQRRRRGKGEEQMQRTALLRQNQRSKPLDFRIKSSSRHPIVGSNLK